MYRELRNYSGNALFSLIDNPDLSFQSNFVLRYCSNGQVFIDIKIPWEKTVFDTGIASKSHNLVFSMRGILSEPSEALIEADQLRVNSRFIKNGEELIDHTLLSISSVTINFGLNKSDLIVAHYGLTNFIFTGEIIQFCDSGNFEVSVNSKQIGFRKVNDYFDIVKFIVKNNSIDVTTEVIINGTTNELEATTDLVEKIGELLSLASGIDVSAVYVDIYSDDKLVQTIFFPIITQPYMGDWEIINLRDASILRLYLERGYRKYQEFRDSFCLDAFIFFKNKSEQSCITEIKFILGLIALESICGHFEEYQKSIGDPIQKRSIIESENKIRNILKETDTTLDDEIIKKIARSVAISHPYFKDKLKALLEKFIINYSNDDLKLIRIRDNIVHYGKFPENIDEFLECDRLSDLLTTIILKILDYQGKYISRMTEYKQVPLK